MSIIILTLLGYFICLYLFSLLSAKKGDNNSFFHANHQSPWYLVAFGMIGASISGVTFVSVPGMVINQQMTYLQTCLGFIFGYIIVAFVLLPLYYRLRLTTIYTYLEQRFGTRSYQTGAWFFLISKMIGSAVKFYVVCMILQRYVLDAWDIPFTVTVVVLVTLIWLYTRRGGIRTLVLTDSFQTLCMLVALVLIIHYTMDALHLSVPQMVTTIMNDAHSKVFVWDDWGSTQHFMKQFFSGIFIVIVMTGLDQDMMQKNLTCKSLREAQKDMCTYGVAFLPANLLFLSLGVLLLMLAQQRGIDVPTDTDELMLLFTAGGQLGTAVTVLFTIGIVAACFSSADSALTSLTTSFCIDIKHQPNNEQLRKWTHIGMAIAFVNVILLFRIINSTSLINAIYIIVSYTYGPLLGLFAFGLFTKRSVNDRLVPYIAVASPVLCFLIDTVADKVWGYRFGYELLMLNGLITFTGLWLSDLRQKH